MDRPYQTHIIQDLYKLAIGFQVTVIFAVLFIEEVDNGAKIFLVGLTGIFIILWTTWPMVDPFLWRLARAYYFHNPRIGMLFEHQIKPVNSDYSPFDWLNVIEKKYDVSMISAASPLSKYAIIINPYGEGYPEISPLSLTTMSKIKEYVYNGGVFTSIGGYPFFYAIDTKSKQELPIAKKSTGLGGTIDGMNVTLQNVVYLNSMDLLDGTILSSIFPISVTTGKSEEVQIFQTDADKQFCKDLLHDGLDRIFQFRSFIAPLVGARPMLRAHSPTFGEIYPLIAFPYGRGYFIFGGIRLYSRDLDGQELAKEYCKNGLTIGCQAIFNIIEQIKLNEIEPHDEKISNFSKR